MVEDGIKIIETKFAFCFNGTTAATDKTARVVIYPDYIQIDSKNQSEIFLT